MDSGACADRVTGGGVARMAACGGRKAAIFLENRDLRAPELSQAYKGARFRGRAAPYTLWGQHRQHGDPQLGAGELMQRPARSGFFDSAEEFSRVQPRSTRS